MTKITENQIEETMPQYTLLPKLFSGKLQIVSLVAPLKEAV